MSTNDKNDKLQVFDDEKSILLDHNYDGIHELDHPLPSWWVTIFISSVIFSIPYYLYYTHFGGPTLDDELKESVARIEKAQSEYKAKQGGFDIDKFNAYVVTKKAQKSGKKTYRRKCKACHGAAGEGGIGPNLTDNYWIHGDGSIAAVYKVVEHGVIEKGMQAWGQTLGEEKMMAVVDYVMKLRGTNPANAKAPQGELFE
jgi:cytochrome c oxidase cbb3-type subunit 3